MLAIVSLIGGLILLLAGGHYLVAGGVSLARHFNISTLVVGITVIAFGTSAPELIVGLKANLQNYPNIMLGNIIGSSIANVGLVLAVSTVVLPIIIIKGSFVRDWLIMMGSYVVLGLFFLDGQLDRWEGAVMVVLLLTFIFVSLKRPNTASPDSDKQLPEHSLWLAVLMLVGSIAGLSYGADMIVDGASRIARIYGVSERVISVSLIAVGTSIPELATSLIAAFKKEMDISVGNIIGSNIFNILGVAGISTIVSPVFIDRFWQQYMTDMIVMGLFSILLLLAFLPMSRGIFDRWKGALMVVAYFGYIYLIF